MSALGSAKDALTNGGGFANANLGLSGANLSLPGLSNAPGYVPPTPGVGAGALGYVDALGRATMNIPGLSLANAPSVAGTPAYTLGGLNPASLYTPQSLGGAPDSKSLGNVADALKVASQLSAAGGETPVGTAAPPVGGGITGSYQSTTPMRQIQPFRPVINGANPFLSGMLRA